MGLLLPSRAGTDTAAERSAAGAAGDGDLVQPGRPGWVRGTTDLVLLGAVSGDGTPRDAMRSGRRHGPREHPLPPGLDRRHRRQPRVLPSATVDPHLYRADADVLIPCDARNSDRLPDR